MRRPVSTGFFVVWMWGCGPGVLCTGVHFHHCPCCFQTKPCVERCTREFDLEEGRDDGLQMGCHARCDDCEREGAPLP